MREEEVLVAVKEAVKAEDVKKAEELLLAYKEELRETEDKEDAEAETMELAVRAGCTDYIVKYMDELGYYETGYLYDFADEKTAECLKELGLVHDYEHFEGFSLAIETVNGCVISFTPEFQQKAWNEYLKKYGLTEADIVRALTDEDCDPDTELGWGQQACEAFKAVEEEGKIVLEPFEFMEDTVDIYTLQEIMEDIGYEFDFEGDTWKLGDEGVYFIK